MPTKQYTVHIPENPNDPSGIILIYNDRSDSPPIQLITNIKMIYGGIHMSMNTVMTIKEFRTYLKNLNDFAEVNLPGEKV